MGSSSWVAMVMQKGFVEKEVIRGVYGMSPLLPNFGGTLPFCPAQLAGWIVPNNQHVQNCSPTSSAAARCFVIIPWEGPGACQDHAAYTIRIAIANSGPMTMIWSCACMHNASCCGCSANTFLGFECRWQLLSCTGSQEQGQGCQARLQEAQVCVCACASASANLCVHACVCVRMRARK